MLADFEIHVPFEVTWQHENNHQSSENADFIAVTKISEIFDHNNTPSIQYSTCISVKEVKVSLKLCS